MKHTYRRLLAAGTALGVLISTFTVQPDLAEAAQKAKVSSVKVTNIKNKKVTLTEGKTFTLKTKVSVKPNKEKYKKVTYKSSDKKVVTVSTKGKIKAIRSGKAKVTVASKVNGKKKVVIAVTVKAKSLATATPTAVPQEPTPTQEPTDTPEPTKAATPTPVPTQKPDGTSTLMRKPFAEQAYVGESLSEVEVKSGEILDSNGNAISGSYVWEEPTKKLETKGKTHYNVKFVPTSSEFKTIEHISIPVIAIKRPVILEAPTASATTTGKKLSSSVLAGGSAKDADGKTVPGKFSWADGDMILTHPSEAGKKTSYAVVFTPEDTKTYRTEMVYSKVSVTGSEPVYATKQLDISKGNWRNEKAYTSPWNGSFYEVTPYIKGIDVKKYAKLAIKATAYDANMNELKNKNETYVGIKLANRNNDWWGFSDGYSSGDVTLNLMGYTGGEMWLCVQNFSAQVAYIEITAMELQEGEFTNVWDGSSVKLAFGDMFDKVGNCMGRFETDNFNSMNFLTTHYNSITMGNELKPDYLLGGTPVLQDSNPEGYVPVSSFTNEYKDDKYFKIDMDAIDRYMELAYNNGVKLRYHVFVWHQQTPKWFFKKNFDEEAAWVTPDVMNGRLEYFIRNVMTHVFEYKNKDGVYIGREVFDSWDMVNEYFNNGDSDPKSYWDEVFYPDYKHVKGKHSGITKPVYVKQAFAIGHGILEDYKLTDQINLVYNDYNTYNNAEKIVEMIQYINTKDEINPNAEILCDGVGMQLHIELNNIQDAKKVRDNALRKFKAAGFEIQPTEMDVADYDKTEKTQKMQICFWYNLMTIMMSEKDSGAKITGLVWWGLDDAFSWRRNGDPLLFSSTWKAKDHYFRVMDAVSNYNQGDSELIIPDQV